MLRLFTVFCTSLLLASGLFAAPANYKLKAAFIYNFAKFMTWPSHSAQYASNEITICILGQNPFNGSFDPIIGKEIGGRKMALRTEYYLSNMDVDSCAILYISQEKAFNLDDIQKAVGTKPILTVSDISNFANQGMIEFVEKGERIRFDINSNHVTAAHIAVSSKLLELARKVKR